MNQISFLYVNRLNSIFKEACPYLRSFGVKHRAIMISWAKRKGQPNIMYCLWTFHILNTLISLTTLFKTKVSSWRSLQKELKIPLYGTNFLRTLSLLETANMKALGLYNATIFGILPDLVMMIIVFMFGDSAIFAAEIAKVRAGSNF